MAPVAQRLAADAVADEPDFRLDEALRGSSEASAEVTATGKIVPLFAASEIRGATPGPVEAAAVDWPSALERIRGAGAHLRRMHDVAQAMSRHAQAILRRNLDQTEEAERRAGAAEADAAAARMRADRAEEGLRQAEARARLAEDRAEAAEAAEAETQLWLRRTYACLKNEFAMAGTQTR